MSPVFDEETWFNRFRVGIWPDYFEGVQFDKSPETLNQYIQFNLEHLRDLKDHINNKIDFEQNRIFKILTVATICIALPTLVAGIYGMNFETMPELQWVFGYPLTIVVMALCAILPFLYFKKKKWL